MRRTPSIKTTIHQQENQSLVVVKNGTISIQNLEGN
jgi:hypothetical protein